MIADSRLLTFALRAVVVLLAFALLWSAVLVHYNRLLVFAASRLLPGQLSARVLGQSIVFEQGNVPMLSIDALTLHFGLILFVVVVLSAVGLGTARRLVWLAASAGAILPLHIGALIALAHGLVWASQSVRPEQAEAVVFGVFAVFWGLFPLAAVGCWVVFAWLPHAAESGRIRSAPPVDGDAASIEHSPFAANRRTGSKL